MKNFTSIDGQIEQITGGDILLSSAVLLGKGIFTTIAIYNSRPFLWEKHWYRLIGNAAAMGIDLSDHPEAAVMGSLLELLERNDCMRGRARITFFDESPSALWSDSAVKKIGFSILTGDIRPAPKEFNLTISPYRVNSTSPLAGVKSCNYLENILAMDEAKARGFHEVIRINERGEVTSAAMANLFWLKDRKLYTPALSTGCLAGTTREFINENLECEEVKAEIAELETADEIYLTSAGIGVVPVADFKGRRLDRKYHPILDLLPATS